MGANRSTGRAAVAFGLLVGAVSLGACDRWSAREAPSTTLWYLGHSGVVVETGDHLLVFNYSEDRPVGGAGRGLATGVVEPGEIAGRRVVVFFSHEHHDHFWPEAIGWLERIPDLRFVVPPEVAEVDPRFAARAGVVEVTPLSIGRPCRERNDSSTNRSGAWESPLQLGAA